MVFTLILIATVAACFGLRKSLKRHPNLFYGLAIGLEVLYGVGCVVDLPDLVWKPLYLLMQQCMLAMALFIVVMCVGAFSRESLIGRKMRPIRTELSIIACLLVVGHMVIYLPCIPRLFKGALVSNVVLVGLISAVLLTVLTVILGVTSSTRIKKWMGTTRWKNVQKLAYLFYAVVYLHLLVVLMPSMQHGVTNAIVTAAVYTLVFAVYAVVRVRRAILDNGSFPFAITHSNTLRFAHDEPLHNVATGND